jgi:hypothetical protein
VIPALCLLLALAGGAHSAGLTTVSYVTSTTLYANAGSADGLLIGDTVRILRDGVEIATTRVTSLSPRRSALEAPKGIEIVVGDALSFTPHAVASPDAVAARGRVPKPPPGNSVAGWLHGHGWRGRMGLRFFGLFNDAGEGQYREPAVDLRADGVAIGREDINVTLDIRTRRTFRTSADGSTDTRDRSRVYKAVAHWRRAESPWRVSAGRQFSTALSSVSLFDGVSVERSASRWTGGAYVGTQPDYADYGFSTDMREQGVYAALHNPIGGGTRWSAGGAFIGSYHGSTVNREHFALQGRWSNARLFATALQEVDLNRGWRGEHENVLSFTNAYVTARMAATERLSLNGGFDTRRNVRLYRDRITPETEFDDSYRRGYWGGASLSMGARSSVYTRIRRSGGGTEDASTATTIGGRTRLLARSTLSFGARATRYVNGRTEGWLSSVSNGMQLGRAHVELSLGRRRENAKLGSKLPNDLTWGSIDLDARISPAWFALLSLERNSGDEERNTQVYANALYRF